MCTILYLASFTQHWVYKIFHVITCIKVKVKSFSCVRLFATPWTVAYQAPLSMGFSRQEYWSGLPFPSPGDLPKPGIEPGSPTLEADNLTSEPPGKPSPLVALLLIFISGIFKKDIRVCITDSLCCTPETNMTL